MASKSVRLPKQPRTTPNPNMATEVINSLTPNTYSAEDLAAVRGTTTQPGSGRLTPKTLGQNEFFKLLTAQLASQDPLNPMEDIAFIAQMASFSELEMTSQLTKSFKEFTNIQQFSTAQGYIGKTVSLSDGTRGIVTSIEHHGEQTKIFFDGSNSDGRDVKTVNRVEQTIPKAEG